jgi:hypothetical protein
MLFSAIGSSEVRNFRKGEAVSESCFVVMAIGNQSYDGVAVTAACLKDAYENVIKEALLQARPGLEITRSDQVSAPGTITTDILTRLMHSTFVVVDITYPNPNVFYELGVRHACKPGTILIRDVETVVKAPFDVSHQRHTPYNKTPAGIKALATEFRQIFAWYDSHTSEPDNQLLSLAKLINYNFPQYGHEVQAAAVDKIADLFTMVLSKPELLSLSSDASLSPEEKQKRMLAALASDPNQAKTMIKLFFGLGSFGPK